jgi:hypothetical protein
MTRREVRRAAHLSHRRRGPRPGCDNDLMRNGKHSPRLAGSAGSLLSIGSSGSILSIGSAGSILSIGSAGSILSIGSAGSFGSVLSVGSFASAGSVMSGLSCLSVLAWQSWRRIELPWPKLARPSRE